MKCTCKKCRVAETDAVFEALLDKLQRLRSPEDRLRDALSADIAAPGPATQSPKVVSRPAPPPPDFVAAIKTATRARD